MKTSEAIRALADYAVARPEGYTYQDVARDLGWPRWFHAKTARALRRVLGHSDEINLVCQPADDPNGPWVYQLIGTLDGAGWWVANRLRDAETRVETIRAVCASLVRATDGRTADGRRARIMARGLGRVIEDLAELDHGGPPLF